MGKGRTENIGFNDKKAGPAERIFKWGGLMRTRYREPTRGSVGMLPRENLKLKSS